MSDRTVMSCGNTRGGVASIKQNVEGFVRRIDFEPGYDCHTGYLCVPRHGRHGMNLRFLLATEEGAVQFLMYACDWLPGSLDSLGSTRSDLPKHGAMASDLGHHWSSPVYFGAVTSPEEAAMHLSNTTHLSVAGASVTKHSTFPGGRYTFIVGDPRIPFPEDVLYFTGTLDELAEFADTLKAAIEAQRDEATAA